MRPSSCQKAVGSGSVQFECASTAGELERYFAQHYEITVLHLRTLKEADPELWHSLGNQLDQTTCEACIHQHFSAAASILCIGVVKKEQILYR